MFAWPRASFDVIRATFLTPVCVAIHVAPSAVTVLATVDWEKKYGYFAGLSSEASEADPSPTTLYLVRSGAIARPSLLEIPGITSSGGELPLRADSSRLAAVVGLL